MTRRAMEPVLSGVVPPLWPPEVAEQMRSHLGRWVALEDGQIIGAADTLDELLDRADADGYREPLVFRVPADPDRVTRYAGQPKGS